MSPDEALAWLYSTQQFGIKLGLENTFRLLEALGNPHVSSRYIHVAGTNGKGSVCAMLDAITRAEGLRTGLYTSPHLVSFRERIRVNGEKISDGDLAGGLARIRQIVEGWDHAPTFFEIATCLAIDHFAKEGCDIVVLETGMGGRLDATNAVTPLVSVITPIARDHERWLGTTLAEIASEKAGIIKPGRPVVSAPQQPEAFDVLAAVAEREGSRFKIIDKLWNGVSPALRGEHQLRNASLAVAALNAAGICPSTGAVDNGLASVHWPGRFQVTKTGMVLDGAHNPQAAAHLVETWGHVYGDEKVPILFGALEDKDFSAMLRLLDPLATGFLFVPVSSDRGGSPREFPKYITKPWKIYSSPKDALLVNPSRLLVTGSLFLVGEVMNILEIDP